MRRTRGILASVISVALFGSVLTACSSGSGTTTQTSNSKADETVGKVEKVVIALPSFNKIPDDMSSINDAINKITTKKINVEVDLKVYGPADYSQKVNLALQSGERLDLFTSPGQFASYAAKNMIYPMEDLIQKYGQEMQAILDKDFGQGLLKATTLNGHIYGIPANKGMAIPINFVYNADMLKEAGFTENDIKSVNDLPKIFEAVKQKHPDVVPFAPIGVNPSDTNLIRFLRGMNEIDVLTDETGVGVVVGNSNKVVNLYETDIFKNGVKMMRDWYNKGYLQKDVATTSTSFADLGAGGRGFSTLGGYSGMEAGKALSAQIGKPVNMKRIAPFYFDTQAIDFVVWMLSGTTKVPDAAMKLLNLIYTDKDLLNTMLYGIEGRDYVKADEHHVKYPDGKDASTVPYTAQLSSGILGSESLQYQLEGMDWKDTEVKLKENKDTKRSPYFGFIFDPSSVKTEMSAVNNVVNQFLSGVVTGALDPDTTIPKFVKALNDAGAQTIIKKKQEQLDKWIAEQEK